MRAEYEALKAKCRCMTGKLLEAADYQNMLKCETLAQSAAYLCGSTYYKEFPGGESINTTDVHRGKLELYLKKTLFYDYAKMVRFLNGSGRQYLNIVISKYEFEFLLGTWRYIALRKKSAAGQTPENNSFSEELSNINILLGGRTKINTEILTKAVGVGGLDEFLSAIHDTAYYKQFVKYVSEDVQLSYSQLETKLYSEYYAALYERTDLFDKKTKEQLQAVIGIMTDLINIARIYRMNIYFNSPENEIIPHLFPLKGRLTKKDIKNLVSIKDKEKFYEYCGGTYYAKKQDFHVDVSFSEYTARYVSNYYKKYIYSADTSYFIVNCYFYLKDIEIKNLINIIEGIRYGIPREQTEKRLILI